MRSMSVTEFEIQIRKTKSESADAVKPVTAPKKEGEEGWWETYRSGSFC